MRGCVNLIFLYPEPLTITATLLISGVPSLLSPSGSVPAEYKVFVCLHSKEAKYFPKELSDNCVLVTSVTGSQANTSHNGVPLTHPLRLFSRSPHFAPYPQQGKGADAEDKPKMVSRCVLVPAATLEKKSLLRKLLTSPAENAIHLCGLRFLTLSKETLALSAQKLPTLKGLAEGSYLVMMIRGPSLIPRWTAICGPSDPSLARLTDPDSIRAR